MTRFPLFPHHRRAFTLTEILLVIVISAILLVLMFPMSDAMRAQTKGMGCVANLRVIGVALHSYAREHNGNLPFFSSEQRYWYAPLTLATKLVGHNGSAGYLEWNTKQGAMWSDRMLCPADPNAALWRKDLGYPRSYMYRQTDFSTAWETEPMRLLHKSRISPTGAIQHNNRRWLVTDRWSSVPAGTKAPYSGQQIILANTGVTQPDNWTLASYWHKGGTNVLYEDGGVEWKAFGDALGK